MSDGSEYDSVLGADETEMDLEYRMGGKDLNKDQLEQNGFTQYFYTPDGYLPTLKTVTTLPAGLYSVGWDDNRRNVVFSKETFKTDNLIVFPGSLSNIVCNEIKSFWESKDKFQKSGVVYKRGFLLYGSPGSGKTTTVNFVIKDIVERNGVVFLCKTEIGSFIKILKKFRAIEPSRQMVIIFEDVDKLMAHKDNEGLCLQLLDGNQQIDGVVFLATTNQPEILDPNITNRPSRFDQIIKILPPNKIDREIYLKSFNALTEEELLTWTDKTEGLAVSHIKELFISVKIFNKDFMDTVNRLKGMKVMPKQSGEQTIGIKNEN